MKSQQFFIEGTLIGLNEIISLSKISSGGGRGGRRWNRYNDTKQEIESRIMVFLNTYNIQPMQKAFIHYLWVEKNKKRDLDNIAVAKKFINDALVKKGILQNDGWKNIIGFKDSFEVANTNSGVLVTLHSDEI